MTDRDSLKDKTILLIMGGGIAAYKVLEAIRRLKEHGARLRVVMTPAARAFITPLSVGALTGEPVHTELFDLTQEQEISHVELARSADLVLIAPATADLIARMAHGLANDLASACYLIATAPVLLCPAMNPAMWHHPTTQRNIDRLRADGVLVFGPATGKMAEAGVEGIGRLEEPYDIVARVIAHFQGETAPRPLQGRHVLVTSGPTIEPIDPVRYIANRSSGRQGHAIAAAAAAAGARVTLLSGPVSIPDPPGVTTIHVETAREMHAAMEQALPADIAIMAAAIADWRLATASEHKLKKDAMSGPPILALAENPDLLAMLARHERRPLLVVGFAAETERVEENARAKLAKKGADLIVANDVSPGRDVMGGAENTVHLVTPHETTTWPKLPKEEVAKRLIAFIAERFPPSASTSAP